MKFELKYKERLKQLDHSYASEEDNEKDDKVESSMGEPDLGHWGLNLSEKPSAQSQRMRFDKAKDKDLQNKQLFEKIFKIQQEALKR